MPKVFIAVTEPASKCVLISKSNRLKRKEGVLTIENKSGLKIIYAAEEN